MAEKKLLPLTLYGKEIGTVFVEEKGDVYGEIIMDLLSPEEKSLIFGPADVKYFSLETS